MASKYWPNKATLRDMPAALMDDPFSQHES